MEETIAYFCAPALAGIKPANLVACYKKQIPNVHNEIDRLNHELNGRGIYFEILCECDKRVLLMVYRKQALYEYLKKSEIKELLISFEYPAAVNLKIYFETLKTRLSAYHFPHEIGAFLGYPAHDIYGFINHKENGCLFTGEWKVYQDAETAKKLFHKYTICRRALVKRLAQGKTLAEIFCAA